MLNTYFFYSLLFAVVGVPFYFQYRTQNTVKEHSALPAIDSLAAKLSAFLLISLYVMSFASESVGKSYTKISYCACFLSFFLLYAFRSKIIHEIREIPAKPVEKFKNSLRTVLAMTLLYGIYFSTVHLLMPHTGSIPAIAVAMIFITYVTPLIVRVWMPSKKMYHSTIKEDIMTIFASANNPVHEVYLINTDRFKTYNAMVCGPKFGFGPLKRSVFITQNLFEVLEPEEIKAVMCHEASHFKLHHIFKRGLMGIFGFLVSIACVVLPIVFISMILKLHTHSNIFLLIIPTIATVVVQYSFIYRVIRKQEFEADLEALKLGATVSALSSALEKITNKNGAAHQKADWISRFMFGHAHPSLEERKAALLTGILPANSKILPPSKYTVSYASIVVLLGTFALFGYDGKKNKSANREVASAKIESTRQILPPPENQLQNSKPNAEK